MTVDSRVSRLTLQEIASHFEDLAPAELWEQGPEGLQKWAEANVEDAWVEPVSGYWLLYEPGPDCEVDPDHFVRVSGEDIKRALFTYFLA